MPREINMSPEMARAYQHHCEQGGVIIASSVDGEYCAVFSDLALACSWVQQIDEDCTMACFLVNEPNYGLVDPCQMN